MAASAKKKNKKGKTLTLTDFLAEDSSGNAPPSYPTAKPTSWADETDDLDGDVSTSWHTDEDTYRPPPIDRSILPTAPRAAREPNIDRARLPRSPPYTAFLGNVPYGVTEESIKHFFRGLAISAVRLPREPNNPERLKGFGYAEFDDVESLLSALSLNDENLGNRRIKVDIADHSNDKERDSWMGRDRDRGWAGEGGSNKTDSSDWRARPSSDQEEPPRRDDTFGERSRDRYESDRYRDGPRRDNDRFRDRYDDRGGFDSRGGGRRAFGSGFRRDYDDRGNESRGGGGGGGGGDRYGDRYGDREERYERREERAPLQRPKLNLKPRSVPKEDVENSEAPAPAPTRASSIFGSAKPVDTAAKEREVEERLKKEQERLQRQLEEDKHRPSERKPRDRWRNEEQPGERSTADGDSSQPRRAHRRESERSVENEVFSGKEEEEPPSPGSRSPASSTQEALPLKVMPAPPPKENAWARRSAGGGAPDGEERPPVSQGNKSSSSASGDERGTRKDENSDGDFPRGRGGPGGAGAGRGRGEAPYKDRQRDSADKKDAKKEREPRPAPEPKKYEETPTPKFSSASKYAALMIDGDQGDDDDGCEE